MLVYTAAAMGWGPVCWVLLAEIFPDPSIQVQQCSGSTMD